MCEKCGMQRAFVSHEKHTVGYFYLGCARRMNMCCNVARLNQRLVTRGLVAALSRPPLQPTAPLMRIFPLTDHKQHPSQNNNKCLAKAI